ncbi:MAG: CBS domain-containing protein [Candidatus Aenigmarchaeota archaeon]|nr:CBS domain-containing protein [Candidatus Aenigmarchaeota archaeon]
MKVNEIMSKDLKYVKPNDSVSDVLSLIEKNCFREVLVLENNKLEGIVYSKQIAGREISDPTRIKVRTVMGHMPATIRPDQEIEEAAQKILRTGLRALPVLDNKVVVGIISLSDIVDAASKSKAFRQAKAETVMSKAETIYHEDDIGTARFLMREKNISRLPVVDSKKKIVGVVTIFDLLRAVKPSERMNFYSMSAEKLTTRDILVSTVMNKRPTSVDKKTPLSESINLMRKYDTDGVIVSENNSPIGVVTEKDLLEYYVSSLNPKGPSYQISGLEEEDDFVMSTINRMLNDSMEKLSKIVKNPFLFLHVKRYERKGRVKYSIRARLSSERGFYVTKSYAWDFRSAVDEALDKLEKIVIKNKKSKRDRLKEMLRFKKLLR